MILLQPSQENLTSFTINSILGIELDLCTTFVHHLVVHFRPIWSQVMPKQYYLLYFYTY